MRSLHADDVLLAPILRVTRRAAAFEHADVDRPIRRRAPGVLRPAERFLVEIGAEGERRWLPSDKIEPDKSGSTVPPDGAKVVLPLALNDEGGLEVARVRPQ